ncbi:MAG: hypothetical protein ABL895_10110 [Cyclobacteriaceae bacterium]
MQVPLLIAYASAASVFIPLIWITYTWQYRDQKIRYLFYLLIASLLSDLIGLILFKLSLNTYIIVNFFLLIQFMICYQLLTEEKNQSASVRIIPIGFLLIFVVNYFFIQSPGVFNSYSNSIACLILMFFSVRYFYTLLRDLPEVHIMRIPLFWIAVGVLTYYSGNLLLFIVNNYLTIGNNGSHPVMWILHNILNFSKNILFTIAIWQNYRKRK